MYTVEMIQQCFGNKDDHPMWCQTIQLNVKYNGSNVLEEDQQRRKYLLYIYLNVLIFIHQCYLFY